MNISDLPVDQPERMRIRHTRRSAKTAKDIGGSHLYTDHIVPVNDRQFGIFGKTDIADRLRIIKENWGR